MDVPTILIILIALFVILLPVAFYLRRIPGEAETSEYEYMPLAQEKKAEMDKRSQEMKDKQGLEDSWRFGMRTFEFMSHYSKTENRGPEFTEIMLQSPEPGAKAEAKGALQCEFQSDDGPRRLVLFRERFSPKWLQQVDPTAFFRIVQVLDEAGNPLFQSSIKFLVQDGKEQCTGTILQRLELGSWSKAIRQLLTEFEREQKSKG